MLASFTLMPAVASDYEFSYGPRRLEWTPGYWHGKHEFPGVFCLTFPRPQSASSLDTGMLNGNAITFVRANYNDRAAYVVTSTLPEGLSEADDLASLMANEQRNATQINAAGGHYEVARIDTRWVPVITVRIANVREDAPDGPFPLVRHVFSKDNGPILTMSSHRCSCAAATASRSRCSALRMRRLAMAPEQRCRRRSTRTLTRCSRHCRNAPRRYRLAG